MTTPYPSPIPAWPGLTHLTKAQVSQQLDLDKSLGQRQATFRFDLINAVTHQLLGQLHPIRQPATVSHDTSRTTKRQLGAAFGVTDTAAIDPIQDRILAFMLVAGSSYPLGRFIMTDKTDYTSTGGRQSAITLLDEMFLVDQAITISFAASGTIEASVRALLGGLPLVGIDIAPSPYPAIGSWPPGTTRGQILSALAVQGDYFTPWFDNSGVFRMVRTIDPGTAVDTLDFDRGNRVIRSSPTETTNLLTAPNRFLVIGNGNGAANASVVGQYDVPSTAPQSVQNRGFVVAEVTNMQVNSVAQATAAARQIGLSQSVFRTQSLTTSPDPRHDSYDVVRWQGANWLETAWTLQCQDGAPMSHVMRRNFQ